MCSRPCTLRRTRPAPSSTRMCFDVEFSEIGNTLATSVTRASDTARRARMARRVVSETAAKTGSSVAAGYAPIGVNIAAVGPNHKPPRRPPCLTSRRAESPRLLRSPWPCLCAGCIEGDRSTDERLERARVDLLPLMDVDCAPRVPAEARVEELGRVLQRSPFGERELHDVLVRLAGADDSVVRPGGSARARRLHPLHFLDDVRGCLLDEVAHPAQGLAAPVPELGDPVVNALRCRLAPVGIRLLHVLLPKLPGFPECLQRTRSKSASKPGAVVPRCADRGQSLARLKSSV